MPREEWMKMPLRTNWQDRASGKAKVYTLGLKNREVVDKPLNKIYSQDRMMWTNQYTPFSYLVFIVWKTLPNGARKCRAVVDIRGLNDLILPDAYAVPLQSEIISTLQGCTNIACLDVSLFFYRWWLHPDY